MDIVQTWLITGGAGYIGAHIADEFLANGKEVIVYDSLYQGLESRVNFLCKKYKKNIPLIVADIRDTRTLRHTIKQYEPQGIVHTAALKAVGESMENPDQYFEVNFQATATLLKIISAYRIKNFIFSSTAAVYGASHHTELISEGDTKRPISPYGASKLAAEEEVKKFLALPGNRGTSLRFFNVIGTGAPELSDNSIENLVPIVINKLRDGQPPVIYGTDYSTADGTCVRDYIDVRDIARAHRLTGDSFSTLPDALNVGTGRGKSVREVIKLVSTSAGFTDVQAIESDRRPGDSAFLCADVSLIKKAIGFSSKFPFEISVQSLF